MLKIKEISQQELENLYQTRFVDDFHHADLLRPYVRMVRLVEEKKYLASGYYRDGILSAYTLSAISEGMLFVDFFAVCKEMRGGGIGREVLSGLSKAYPKYAIVVEVEDPSFPLDENDKVIREKRVHFYQKNGFVTIPLALNLFGDPYIVMTKNGMKNADTAYRILLNLYDELYSAPVTQENIFLRKK